MLNQRKIKYLKISKTVYHDYICTSKTICQTVHTKQLLILVYQKGSAILG